MEFALFDVVAATETMPEHGIHAGQVGAIVDIFHNPDAYFVEFCNDKGETLALIPLFASQLEYPVLRKAA